MAENPPEWAIERAIDKIREHCGGVHYVDAAQKAFAIYIAQNEEAPVDPLKCDCGKTADTRYDGDMMCRSCAEYCARRDWEEQDMPGGF